MPEYDSIARLFDFFLATSPLMPLYVGVAAMCAARQELLRGECEYSEVHRLLSTLPALSRTPAEGGTPVAVLIRAARVLSTRVPPKARRAQRVLLPPCAKPVSPAAAGADRLRAVEPAGRLGGGGLAL